MAEEEAVLYNHQQWRPYRHHIANQGRFTATQTPTDRHPIVGDNGGARFGVGGGTLL